MLHPWLLTLMICRSEGFFLPLKASVLDQKHKSLKAIIEKAEKDDFQ